MSPHPKDSGDGTLDALIESIMTISAEELSRAWRKIVGKPAPANLPKSLSSRMLAYQLQADQSGDLGKEAIRLLDSIANDLAAGKALNIKPPSDRRLKPGTVLMREHRRVVHRVMVMEEGFAWAGKTYTSLSSAAKAITGTNWNGQRFFGLKEKGRSGDEASK